MSRPKPKQAKPWQCKKFFLTFPQNEETKESLAARLHTEFKDNLDAFVIAHEHHVDGGDHLHVMLHLKEKLESRDRTYFDCLGIKHGNYQKQKSQGNDYSVLLYCSKEDPSPLTFNCDIAKAMYKKANKSEKVRLEIQAGTSYDTLLQSREHGAFTMAHRKAIMEAITDFRRISLKPTAFFNGVISDKNPGVNQVLTEWVEKYVVNAFYNPAPKHLFLCGDTNVGKSEFVRFLKRFFTVCELLNEPWWDGYTDHFDICHYEEADKKKDIYSWLRFLRGQCLLNVKGSSVLKLTNVPTIITSNMSLSDWCSSYDAPEPVRFALYSRFRQVDLVKETFPYATGVFVVPPDTPPSSPSSSTISVTPPDGNVTPPPTPLSPTLSLPFDDDECLCLGKRHSEQYLTPEDRFNMGI